MEIIAKKLFLLAESVLRQENKFRDLPIVPEACSFLYYKYLQFVDELPNDFKRKVLEREIQYAKYLINENLVSIGESFSKLYPTHMQTKTQFEEWIKEREGGLFQPAKILPPLPQYNKVNIKKIFTSVVNLRMPGFKYKKGAGRGLNAYTMKIGDNNILIGFEKGRLRNSISYMIGLEEPFLIMDIANFFSRSQSRFYFNTEEDVELNTIKAINLIENILPHFNEALSNV